MSDLIERLRDFANEDAYGPRRGAMKEAAARIAELEAERDAERRTIAALYIERDAALTEIARKNEALAPFAEEADRYPPGSDWNYPACYSQFLIGVLWDARAALETKLGTKP